MEKKSWVFVATLLLLHVGMSINAEGQQTLHGTVPADIARLGLQSIGRLDGTFRLHLAIGLPLRNQGALTNLLRTAI